MKTYETIGNITRLVLDETDVAVSRRLALVDRTALVTGYEIRDGKATLTLSPITTLPLIEPEPVEPAFKVGQYVVWKYAGDEDILRIEGFSDGTPEIVDAEGNHEGCAANNCTPWLPSVGERVWVDGKTLACSPVRGFGVVATPFAGGDMRVRGDGTGVYDYGLNASSPWTERLCFPLSALHPASFAPKEEKAKKGSLEWARDEETRHVAASVLNDEGSPFWYRIHDMPRWSIGSSSNELLGENRNPIYPSLDVAKAACQAIEDGIVAEAAKQEIAPPADGPWQEKGCWDGKAKRLVKDGEMWTGDVAGSEAHVAGENYTPVHEHFILIPLTPEELQAREAEATKRAAVEWAEAQFLCLSPSLLSHLAAFHKHMQARDDSKKEK